MRIWQVGDLVEVRCDGASAPGVVILASRNGRSLMLSFEGIVAGFLGMMPVLWDDGTQMFRELMQDRPVELFEGRRTRGRLR